MAMSKKKIFAAAFISILLVSMLAGAQFVKLANANMVPIAMPCPPKVSIQFPIQNGTYTTTQVPLIFSVNGSDQVIYSLWGYFAPGSSGINPFSVNYYLDGSLLGCFNKGTTPVYVSDMLTGLSEGTHRLDFLATSEGTREGEQETLKVYFTVDTKPPRILLLSFSNNTLCFHTNEEPSAIRYSLDGKANSTVNNLIQQNDNQSAVAFLAPIQVTGNIDALGLSEGTHNIIFYASDSAGNTECSDLVQFTIDTPQPSTSSSLSSAPSSTLAPTLEPTIEPTSTSEQQTGFLGTNLPTEYGYAIAAVLVIIVVAGLSVVYCKRVRK